STARCRSGRRNSAPTATARKHAPEKTQPCRKAVAAVPALGVPMMTTSSATPRTAPSWRVLETTADAVAKRPPGTAAKAAAPDPGSPRPPATPGQALTGQPLAEDRGMRPHLGRVPEVGAGPDERAGDRDEPVTARIDRPAEDCGNDCSDDRPRRHR